MKYVLVSGSLDQNVDEVIYDSRKARPDSVFVCIQGSTRDSHEFIPDVLKAGCKVLVIEKEVEVPADVTVIRVENGRLALAELSAARFGYPAEKLMGAARRFTLPWCRRAVVRCGEVTINVTVRPALTEDAEGPQLAYFYFLPPSENGLNGGAAVAAGSDMSGATFLGSGAAQLPSGYDGHSALLNGTVLPLSKDANGKKITVDRNRMAFGVKYESRWTVRGEYVTSQGHKISDYRVADDGTTSVSGKDKADGWYATVGAPVTSRCKIYGKWDVYRDRKAVSYTHLTLPTT